jgi:hypothetical protein
MLHIIQKNNIHIVNNEILYLNKEDLEAYNDCDYVQLIAYDKASSLITQENIIMICFIKSKLKLDFNKHFINMGDFILESLSYKKDDFTLLQVLPIIN